MHFLATGRIVHRDGFDDHLPKERQAVEELRTEGVIEEIFLLQPGPGVVSVVSAPSLESAQAHLRRLPFVSAGILEFDLTEVVRG